MRNYTDLELMLGPLTTAMKEEMLAVFKRAKDRLVQKGWHQGAFYKYTDGYGRHFDSDMKNDERYVTTSYCLHGAIRCGANAYINTAVGNCTTMLHLDGCSSAWNDHESTTKEDVLKVIDKMIAKIEAEL